MYFVVVVLDVTDEPQPVWPSCQDKLRDIEQCVGVFVSHTHTKVTLLSALKGGTAQPSGSSPAF